LARFYRNWYPAWAGRSRVGGRDLGARCRQGRSPAGSPWRRRRWI